MYNFFVVIGIRSVNFTSQSLKSMKHIDVNQKYLSIFFLLMAVCSSHLTMAQQELDAYFDHLCQNRKMMGSVAIIHRDSILYAKSVGYADVATRHKNDNNTKFRIGSITKTYTAVMVLQAVEKGKLRLDTYLAAYYPQIKNAEKITIEQMLKHRSGIVNFTDIEGEEIWEQSYHTEAEFIRYIENRESDFEPGTAYAYSNTNYALLGFILEKVYHKPFGEILQENICAPLQLSHTYYSTERDPSRNEAASYNIQQEYIQNVKVNFSNHPASGGMVSTAIELNKFLYALFEGQLISAQSLALMLPANKGEYGMGIEKAGFKNPVGYMHSGRVENYFADYWYFPDEKLGVVTLCNAVNIDLSSIQNTLTLYAFHQQPVLPDFNKTKDLTPDQFSRIKGTYANVDSTDSITISSDGKNLIFQSSAMGQMYVPFNSKGNNSFEYADGAVSLQFIPDDGRVILKQEGTVYEYKKI